MGGEGDGGRESNFSLSRASFICGFREAAPLREIKVN